MPKTYTKRIIKREKCGALAFRVLIGLRRYWMNADGQLWDKSGIDVLVSPFDHEGEPCHTIIYFDGSERVVPVDTLLQMRGRMHYVSTAIQQVEARDGISTMSDAMESAKEAIRERDRKIRQLESELEKLKRYYQE